MMNKIYFSDKISMDAEWIRYMNTGWKEYIMGYYKNIAITQLFFNVGGVHDSDILYDINSLLSLIHEYPEISIRAEVMDDTNKYSPISALVQYWDDYFGSGVFFSVNTKQFDVKLN